MAIDDERDLRNRLGGVLDPITPSPAPVGAVLRRGKAIRTRRRIGVLAGVAAVVVAVAVVVPSLLRHPQHPAPVTRYHQTPKVTVARLSGHVARGLIAEGTIGKKIWRITFDKASDNTLCIVIPGQLPNCGRGAGNAQSVSGIASMGSMGGSHWNSVYGPVRRDVTRISISLSDGALLDLHPFASSGLRWIGLVVPAELRMVEAIAYSGRRELGYSIPFVDRTGYPTFVSWLRPGQTGPARVTRLIGSGVVAGRAWSVVGHAGPWGICEALRSPSDAGTTCSGEFAPGSIGFGVDMMIGAAANQPRWVIGTVPPSVVYLQLTMSDRSTVRVPVVEFTGSKYFVVALTRNPGVVRWGAYDSAGREVLGGRGSIDQWKPKK